ncbi:MAG: glycine--tRNA ligase subunit beta [Sulfitobacter sp.]
MPDLLIELFSEEIPARMQIRAAEDLKKLVTNGLVEAGLTYASAAAFSTPRRLTLTVEGMLPGSPTTIEERKGPKVGAPEKAIEGFLRGAGVSRDQLTEMDTPKGPVLMARIEKPGRPAADIVAQVLEQAVRNFPWPKAMRWGSGSLRWVRPLQRILCLISDDDGAQVVPMDIDGIQAGDVTCGHRFLAPNAICVTGFEDYAAKLKRAFVVLDPAERKEAIWHDATTQAFANGLEVVEDAGLLAEIAGLVEWPVVLMGKIDADFLELPPEVLQTSMREHQKFLSVRNPKSGRIERFITVANRETADDGATILAGNQKVLSARLADAKFFWENDLRIAKSDMSVWVKALENVTFHNKLGTQAELINRMAVLARELAPLVGADPDDAEEAARLAKADLSSEMVYEFPELQGLMGRYYIKAAGKSDAIAAAAQDHYAPLGPSDDVPTAPVSIAVALAEKIDKLTGFWAIDEKPTGSKDPFALRRAALGVIRILVENDLSLTLTPGFSQAFAAHKVEVNAKMCDSLLAFLHDRLKVYLKDQGIRHDVIDACISIPESAPVGATPNSDDINLLVKRARALSETLATDDGENLLQSFKRANNILTQAEDKDGVEYSYGGDVKFAEVDEERALFAALDAAEAKIKPAMATQDFGTAMSAMAALRAPLDAFFEAVQVNSDNPTVRRNRLNLLSQVRQICAGVADLTRIDG